MKALIYGSGAVGLGIAASLLDSNWDVDIKASGKTKAALLENGIKRIGLFKEISIPSCKFKVYEDLSEAENSSYDFIIISTKANSNSDNAKEIYNYKKILGEEGKIVIFQNGWGNDEYYLEHFSTSRVYSARVITGFARPSRNISEVTVHASPILIGSLHGENESVMKPLAQAITNGGIPCEVTNEIEKALWAKMLYNCTLNPLGAVLNVSYGKLTENENSIDIMNCLIEEIYAVMKAAGYETYWSSAEEYKKAFYDELIPPTYNHRSSTLQDIEKRIKTEIDTLNGSVVKLGLKYKIEVPYNRMIYNLIKATESNF